MATTAPISAFPNGIVATNDALALIDVSTVGENATVQTLGRNSVNDGGGNSYAFVAGSSATADNVLVVSTPSTGRWVGAVSFSGVGPITSDRTGYRETFAIFSGFAPVTYTLPPASSLGNKAWKGICATTGTVTVRTVSAGELIYCANNVTPATSIVTTLTGQGINLQAFNGNWFRTDTRFGLI